MIFQVFTFCLKHKSTRKMLLGLKKCSFLTWMVPMLNEWRKKDHIFLENKKDYIGQNCIDENLTNLLDQINVKNPLIVTDENLVKFGIAESVTKNIKTSFKIYSGVKPNPSLQIVNEIYAQYVEQKCDCLISIGGGSAHDACKGVLIRLSDPKKDIKKFQGLNMMKKSSNVPLICVNTTAGTGSETTNVAVITDEERHYKMTLVDKYIQPSYSFNDPMLMLNLPKTHTAWTGIDAFIHAFESYISNIKVAKCSKMALEAMKLFNENIEIVYNEPKNVKARENMCYCEFKAGLAFNQTSLGWVHSVSHSLSGTYNTPHGLANAIMLPYVITHYAKSKRFMGEIKEINNVLGIKNTEDSNVCLKNFLLWYLDKMVKLGVDVNLSNTYKEYDDKVLNKLAKNAMTDFCGISSPVQFSKKQVKKIYLNAFNNKI